MLRMLEPLNNYWPELVVLLRKNIQDGVSPFRLGEILAKEFQTMIDTLGREHQRKFDKLYRTAYDLEKELNSKIEHFTKEKQKYLFTIQTLDEKNQE